MKQVGHNRVGGVAVDQLKSIISRVENLEEQKAGIAADIRDVFAEARGNGFDIPAIRKIIKLRKLDAGEREEQETTLAVYCRAIGMQMSLDLGDDPERADDTAAAQVDDTGDDDLYQKAVTLVIGDRKASTSYIQRRLEIGYNRAASLIERMEREGIVGPANHLGKREVLMHAKPGEAA